MPPVVHVISVVHVVDIDIVGPVPTRRPGFWARINHAKPETPELETWGTFDHHDGDVMDAEPVASAKMRPEAVFRNAVSVVATAFVPGTMLTLPIVGTLAFPDILPCIAMFWFGPSYFVQVPGGMPAVRLVLRTSPDCFMFMGIVELLVPLLLCTCPVSIVLRCRWARALVLVSITFLPVGTTFVISRPPVLCVGRRRCS
jgi:hypothetical protein